MDPRPEAAMPEPDHRRRIVIVGAGFAGFHAARGLARLAGRHPGGIEVVLVNPTDYLLYLPLLPEVAGGILDPRRIAESLAAACPSVRLLLGTVDRVASGIPALLFRVPATMRAVGLETPSALAASLTSFAALLRAPRRPTHPAQGRAP